MSSHQIIRKGPVIGQYENRPIHEFLVYDDGCVLRFSHVAPVERDGTILLSRLSDGDVVVSPGLVYRSACESASGTSLAPVAASKASRGEVDTSAAENLDRAEPARLEA